MEAINTIENTQGLKPVSESDKDKKVESNNESKKESTGEFETLLRSVLVPDQANNISEEELYAGLLQERITQAKGEEAGTQFAEALAKQKLEHTREDGYCWLEDSANAAVKELVQSGVLTQEEAAQIKGQAFTAAQLDNNKEALFDGRGSAEDPTIAVDNIEAALLAARSMIDKLTSGEEVVETPSDPTSETSTTSTIADLITPSGTTVDGANGFLFKPESERNGNLVILAPEALTGKIESLILKDLNDQEVERGVFSSVANGGREHFRFGKTGADYGKDLKVVIKMLDGTEKTYVIPDASQRYD